MTPKYLDKVKTVVDKGLLALNGNRMLIELLEESEKTTKSGIITEVNNKKNNFSADRARVAVVLAVGPGYELDGENTPTGYSPGDHVLVNQFGIKTFGEFFGLAEYKADSIGLVTDDLIQGKIDNFDSFNNILKG